MYYKAAFRSGTTVLYVSIMSESSLKEIKPLLENAKKTRTKLCVLTWNKGISMEIIEALRIHLDENDDDPGLTVRQVRQAALSWRVIEKRYKDNVEVRDYSSCPTFQGLIVKDRWAVIEMLPFHTHPMDRPALILTPTADPELFEMFSGKFESLWRTNGPSSDWSRHQVTHDSNRHPKSFRRPLKEMAARYIAAPSRGRRKDSAAAINSSTASGSISAKYASPKAAASKMDIRLFSDCHGLRRGGRCQANSGKHAAMSPAISSFVVPEDCRNVRFTFASRM